MRTSLDLELYRKELLVAAAPAVRLSVIDVAPECPRNTFVFLHGFGGGASQWQYQIDHFGAENRCIAPDLRGHGRSTAPASGYNMVQILADIHTALEQLQANEKIILVGHSFGGAVASEYAAAFPEQVKRLVLIAAAGEYRIHPSYRLALRLPAGLLTLLAPVVGGRLEAPMHALKAWHQELIIPWSGWSLFRSLRAPTLVLRGNRDLVLDRRAFEEVARAIPDAEEVNLGASAHMVMIERKDAVARAIEAFLEDKPRLWRETQADQQEAQTRSDLVRSRPWLSHYDPGVPYTIAPPHVNLARLLMSSARRFPLRPAIVFAGRLLTYRRLNQLANQCAHGLLRLGLQKGDRVLLLIPNLPQAVIAFFGVLKAGGVVVFTPPNVQPGELTSYLVDSGARFVFTLDMQMKYIRETLETFSQQVQTSDLPAEAGIVSAFQVIYARPGEFLPLPLRVARAAQGWLKPQETTPPALQSAEHYFRPWLSEQPLTEPEPTQPAAGSQAAGSQAAGSHELAVIAYTGGTTAEPKGVMLSHDNLAANAMQIRAWLGEEASQGAPKRSKFERFLCVLPFAHSYGLMTALVAPVLMGATMILQPRFEILEVLESIRRNRPTIFPGVPGMYVALSDNPKVRSYGISSMRACISGAAPLPVEVQETFEKLTRGRLVEGYGLTEASPVTHANPLNGVRKVGSIGIPLPSTEARVVDLKRPNRSAPVGHIGELAVRGPQVMMGYWGSPEATRKVITEDGWLLTGDIAQMDSEGYFRLIARKADMWYQGKSERPAFPRDVEEVLYEIPQVKEVAVVAIAGQAVAFIIARAERPSAEAVIAYARRRLPEEIVPRLVIFVDDFPRTFIGKVLRRELARRIESQG
jgi:long-chain acyl-CoA synthetase